MIFLGVMIAGVDEKSRGRGPAAFSNMDVCSLRLRVVFGKRNGLTHGLAGFANVQSPNARNLGRGV